MVQALKLSSAKSINVVIPYFGYARQDRKSHKHEPITSKLLAELLQTAGAHRVLLVDIHSLATVGYFNIPVDNVQLYLLFCLKVLEIMERWKKIYPVSFVSPDHGGADRVRRINKFFYSLKTNVAIIDKLRINPNESYVLNVLGDVRGRVCFLFDDMIDTGGSIVHAAKILKKKGAQAIYVMATHGLFSGKAPEVLGQAIAQKQLKAIYIFNTIEPIKTFPGVTVLNCAQWLAKFITCLVEKRSFSLVYEQLEAKIRQRINKLHSCLGNDF